MRIEYTKSEIQTMLNADKFCEGLSIIKYTKYKEPARFKCDRHGLFTGRPNQVLRRKSTHGCPSCRADAKLDATRDLIIKIHQNSVFDLLTDRSKILKKTSSIRVRCKKCEKIIKGSLSNLSKNKHGCRICSRDGTAVSKMKFTSKELLELRQKQFPEITIHEIKYAIPVRVKQFSHRKRIWAIVYDCVQCGKRTETRDSTFRNGLKLCSGCVQQRLAKKCSFVRTRTMIHNKSGKKFVIQSNSELTILKYLVKKYGIQKVQCAHHTDPIKYVYKHKPRKYFPDFRVGKKHIIEVKSEWTLGLHPKINYDLFGRNRAKIRSCLEQGYRVTVIVVYGDHRREKVRAVAVEGSVMIELSPSNVRELLRSSKTLPI